jgi:carbon-monoxide dehydrogenase large subunit
MTPSGKVEVFLGVSPHGQGLATSIAQIVADILGVESEDVIVLHGDTFNTPYGQGTFGSRSLVVAGTAAALAAQQIREKILTIAAHLLECGKEDLEVSGGEVRSLSTSKNIPVKEVVRQAYLAYNLPQGLSPGLDSTVYNDPVGLPKSYGAHVCVVEVDEETAEWRIVRYVVIHDAGVVVNPLIVEGQLHGGTLQGLSQTFLEEIIFDERGNLLTTSFMDYLIPSSMEAPSIEVYHHETPSPLNILGVKGVGEGGTIIAPSALANALSDAFGAKFNSTPIRHSELLNTLNRGYR